jgi:DNA-binding response OmpR family regulator
MESCDQGAASKTSWPVILCIDDDPQITEALRLRLRGYEVDVLCADHGTQGYYTAIHERPDLVITDLQMPQGAGNYVLECLRDNAKTHAMPVIVLTGQRGPELSRQLRGMHVDAVLTKPALFADLLAEIARFVPLRERQPQEQNKMSVVE